LSLSNEKTHNSAILFSILFVNAQDKKRTIKISIVEAACGQCQFEMEGYGCELAVRIDGKPYFVDGTPLIPMVMHMMVLCH
jgi:hypothetical protein